jgi:putative methionine-R-sulfoxide reductase with GAF domain
MVILIRAGDDIFGQIDIDAKEKDAFPNKVEDSVRLVADKLAEVFVAERR